MSTTLAFALTLLAVGLAQATLAQATPQKPGPRRITYRTATIDGIRIFYREAGDPSKPTLVLLHGFPSSSHMFRDLIPKLAGRFHLVAPDYPGFGYSDAPPAEAFAPTFARLAELMDRFLEGQGLRRYSLYMQDFGGPVGFRIALRHPERIDRLVVQNANAYQEGLAPNIDEGNRRRAAHPETEAEMAFELGPELGRLMYRTGSRNPEALSPDAWTLDEATMGDPDRRRIRAGLLNDYQSNVETYPRWQAYLRERQPRTLVVWGKGDPIFLPLGAEAYRKDLKDVRIQLLDAGHFALEEDSQAIADAILAFFEETS